MDTQENKTENSEDKEIDFKVDFRKIICDNKILVVVILSFMAVIAELYLIADDKSYNNFGDYFGGVLNPILAFISFIAILRTVALQRDSIDLQSRELKLTREELKETREELKRSRDAQEQHTKLFKQQQFESTFFNTLKLLCNYSERNYTEQKDTEKNNQDIILPKNYAQKYYYGKESITEQCCRIIVSLFDNIDDFSNDKVEQEKYVNIIKSNLYENLLIAILDLYDQMITFRREKIDYPYNKLKIIIEDFSLLELVSGTNIKEKLKKYKKGTTEYHGQWYTDTEESYNKIIKFFELSAFGNNLYLLKDRIKFENDPKKLEKYTTHADDTVRQVAIDRIKSLKSQNDENK